MIGGVSQTPSRGAWGEGHSASGTQVFLSRASPVNRAPPPPPPRSPEIPRDRVSVAGPLWLGSTVLGASSEAPFLSAHPLQKKKKLSFLVIQYFIHLFVYPLQTPYCGLKIFTRSADGSPQPPSVWPLPPTLGSLSAWPVLPVSCAAACQPFPPP